MINGHTFDSEGRCINCEIAAHNAGRQTCIYNPIREVVDAQA